MIDRDDDLEDAEIDAIATRITTTILQRIRAPRRAEIERLEAELDAEWQRLLDETEDA